MFTLDYHRRSLLATAASIIYRSPISQSSPPPVVTDCVASCWASRRVCLDSGEEKGDKVKNRPPLRSMGEALEEGENVKLPAVRVHIGELDAFGYLNRFDILK